MTLVQLRHLIALAESGSFSKAADQMCLTQPALSRSIGALEGELVHHLFDRIGRHIELTPFGRTFLQRAKQLVFDADELHESGKRMDLGEIGRLRVGMGSGPSAVLIPHLLMHVANNYPNVYLDVSGGYEEGLVRALHARTLDALIIDARSLPPSLDLKTEVVAELNAGFMCRPDHPLAAKAAPVSFAEICRYPVASTPLSDEVARLLVEHFGPDAAPERLIKLRCDGITSLAEAARHSDIVLLAIHAAAPDLVAIGPQLPAEAMARFGLVTLAGRTEIPGMDIVRQLVKDFLHD